MPSTQRFSEYAALLGTIFPASYSSEQNSGHILVANYARVVVILVNGALGTNTTLDCDIEAYLTASGGTPTVIKSITQLTDIGNDDDKVVQVEIDMDELYLAGVNYPYLNVELTPAISTAICMALVYGLEPRFAPVPTTLVDEVVD